MDSRRFARSADVRICGVCGGLADYVGMKHSLMRALWVLAAVFTWFWPVVIAYVILAFIMPTADGAPEDNRFWQNNQGRNVILLIAAGLICTGGLIILQEVLHFNIQRYLLPVGLIAGGGLLMAFAIGRDGRNRQ